MKLGTVFRQWAKVSILCVGVGGGGTLCHLFLLRFWNQNVIGLIEIELRYALHQFLYSAIQKLM